MTEHAALHPEPLPLLALAALLAAAAWLLCRTPRRPPTRRRPRHD